MCKPFYSDEFCTIFHGDCKQILPELDVADLVLTDPPYGIGEAKGKNKSRSKLAKAKDYGVSDWDDKPIDLDLLNAVIGTAQKAIIFGGNYYSLPASSCWLVWDKDNGETDFADCELAWTNLNGAVRLIKWRWNGMLKKVPEERWHPTQKPLGLMQWCIQQADKKTKKTNNIILDPFMGSGTTLVAAKNLGRKAIGIEKELKYCEVAAQRLRQGNLFGGGVACVS